MNVLIKNKGDLFMKYGCLYKILIFPVSFFFFGLNYVFAQSNELNRDIERQFITYVNNIIIADEAEILEPGEWDLARFSIPVKEEEKDLLDVVIHHLENGGRIWISIGREQEIYITKRFILIFWNVSFDRENNLFIFMDSGH